MPTTQLPSFQDPVHDAQQTFRALLAALARPGMAQTTPAVTAPEGLTLSCAAACLTLLDLETSVWLQPGIPTAAKSWLLFHTGCRFADQPQTADFAVIGDSETMPRLDSFHWGTAEYPEASTALLIQSPSLRGQHPISLAGPGIIATINLQTPLSRDFWQQWREMTAEYPLGLDVWLLSENQVLGLPRTARIASDREAG